MSKKKIYGLSVAAILVLLGGVVLFSHGDTKLEAMSEEADKDLNEINIHVDSPNHQYRAETVGEENLGGRRYPSSMRVVDLQTNSVLWEESGYLDTAFLWSPDSKYLSIAY